MANEKGKEARAQVRLNSSVVVSYHVASDKFLKMSCRGSNVSDTGIKLTLYQHLEPGKLYDFEINFDATPKPIAARGEVVWCRRIVNARFPFEAGIKFVLIDSNNLDRLREALSRIPPDDSEGGIIELIKPITPE
jgi:hypothetical protein